MVTEAAKLIASTIGAVVLGSIVANIIELPIMSLIGQGHEENFFVVSALVLSVLDGAICGIFAALFNKNNEAFAGIVTALIPWVVFGALNSYQGRHSDDGSIPYQYSILVSNFPTICAAMWIGRNRIDAFHKISMISTLILIYSIALSSFALHVYTMILSYRMYGFFAAVVTFILPVFSEFFTLVKSIRDSGHYLNPYSALIYTLLFYMALLIPAFYIALKIDGKKKSQLNINESNNLDSK